MPEPVSYRVEQPSRARPEAVYDVLADVDRWAEWMPTVSAASWSKRGDSGSDIGGIRCVRSGLVVVRDHVTAGSRPHHHAYTAVVPRATLLREFHGDVRIEDRADGSLIVWTVTVVPVLDLLAPVMRRQLRSTYPRIAAALAAEAER